MLFSMYHIVKVNSHLNSTQAHSITSSDRLKVTFLICQEYLDCFNFYVTSFLIAIVSTVCVLILSWKGKSKIFNVYFKLFWKTASLSISKKPWSDQMCWCFRNVNGPRNLTNKVADVYLVNKCCTLKEGSLFSVGHTSIRPIDSSPRPTLVHLSPSANHGIQVFSSAYIHCTCMINFNNVWAEQPRNPISFSKYLLYSAFICHSKSHVTKYGREWH